jgi:hypothetical protein
LQLLLLYISILFWFPKIYVEYNGDNVVSTATKWAAGFDSRQRREIFIFSTLSRHSLQLNGYWGLFPRGKAARREADHSAISSEVKNMWIYTFPPSYDFILLLNYLSRGTDFNFNKIDPYTNLLYTHDIKINILVFLYLTATVSASEVYFKTP